MGFVIGVDLGGTQLRAALVDTAGQLHVYEKMATAATSGPVGVIDQIARLVRQVAAGHAPILGVGVGVPGPLDPVAGLVFHAPNLPGWRDVPLRERLAERVALPVVIGNDANAAALGEWRFGSGQGCANFIYVTISTGIGGGVIMNGRLLLGRNGGANEVGHMTIQTDGPLCGCGNIGCWEALASGTAMARYTATALDLGRPSLISAIAGTAQVRAEHVAAAARRDDDLARQIMRHEGELIGIGLVNLLHLYAPERIALGGGMMKDLDLLTPHMRAIIDARAMAAYRDTPIGAAQLGGKVGVLGAAALALA